MTGEAATLAVAITHASFADDRRVMLAQQLYMLGEPPVGAHPVHVERDKRRAGLWPTTVRAWQSILASGASHGIVLADDMWPCRDFLATCILLANLQPQRITFALSQLQAIDRAINKGKHWVCGDGCAWGNAAVMSTDMVRDYLAWNEAYVDPEYELDDGRIGMWAKARGYPLWQTAPSLLEHVAPRDSLMGHANFTSSRRVAMRFIGYEQSGLQVDWTQGMDQPIMLPRAGWLHRVVSQMMTQEHAMAGGLGAYWSLAWAAKRK